MAAFISGLIIAGVGALVSLIVQNWQISFIISATVSIITIILASTVKNTSLLMKKRAKAKGEEIEAMYEGERLSKNIMMVALPNIIIAVVIYIKLYM